MTVRSRAPVRIDFAGGWTDVALFTQEQPGAVLNAAINIYSYVTAKKLPEKRVQTKEYGYSHFKAEADKRIRIYSADFDIFEEAKEIKELKYNGNIDLAKAAIKRMGVSYGVELITRSNAPAGSGLGTSASMGVALIGAISRLNNSYLLPYEYAEMASAIERHELGILGGKQDHYASALGGISFMEFMGEEVKTSKLQLSQDLTCELEKSLILCYTGKSRLSGDIHQKVTGAYLSRDENTLSALKNLKQVAVEMKTQLLKGDLVTFGQLLYENWQNQKQLHPSVTNSQIDTLFEIAMQNGAVGGKAGGAGGGGCLVFCCQPEKEHLVRRKLEAQKVQIIDFNFEFDGLQVWMRTEG
jgi:D-glycero-alpha-D-manno-heptose-7-phosphate kinase